MWYFYSPQIFFGEDALSWISQLRGKRAFIVTDAVMEKIGFLGKVQEAFSSAGIRCDAFREVEPDPCLETVKRCAERMAEFQPDWVVGLGGGSCLDTAKAAWCVYARPDFPLEAVSPMEYLDLRSKAKLLTIPTTAGSGAEVTQAAMIKDNCEKRKLEIASTEIVADITIVDPRFSAQMPRSLTADTGIDVLSHAVEGYSSTWANDFTDGLCLQATRMVFAYLPRAYENGADDLEAREKMANAATIAGLGMGNSHIALAHSMGHSAGVIFGLPHGKATGLFLPYTIEFTGNAGVGRYLGLSQILGQAADDENQAALALAGCIRELMQKIRLPLSLREAGISHKAFVEQQESLCDHALSDTSLVTARRIPTCEEMQRLFEYAFEGNVIDF